MRKLAMPGLVLAAALGAGCLFSVRDVENPQPAFAQARAEALRYQGRPGPARELNVLVYEGDEGKLVRACVPMWLVRKIGKKVDADGDLEVAGPEGDRVERQIRRHLSLEAIDKAGLGILVEVEEDDGGQVLVWLR